MSQRTCFYCGELEDEYGYCPSCDGVEDTCPRCGELEPGGWLCRTCEEEEDEDE